MLLVGLAGWINREQLAVIDYLQEENRILRELHGKRRLRFTDDHRRRLAAKGKVLGRRVLQKLGTIVRPDTIPRWHRRLIAAKYDGTANRRAGRPGVDAEVRSLVVRMARDNERWGYTRIAGELRKVGHKVSRSTVRRILLATGIEPAPQRSERMPWRKFLASHWDGIAAADFFTVEAWTGVGLVRYLVFFVVNLPTRRVEIAGVAPIPDGLWMEQVARNLVDDFSGFLRDKRFLIHDRDPLFTSGFREILERAGVHSVRLPARSPNLNAYAERFVLSIKSECLGRLVLLGERHLRRAIGAYMTHYHQDRPHQGRGNRLLVSSPMTTLSGGPITKQQQLGGLLNSYHRRAA
ncbi:MAG: helix-turn-helix domain-containing protein [Acidimicrobiia bacterium]|nr:helix-turn-helix domain-containing protein [Acidimicrobiia bacterium]